jgi:hypothetical protein
MGRLNHFGWSASNSFVMVLSAPPRRRLCRLFPRPQEEVTSPVKNLSTPKVPSGKRADALVRRQQGRLLPWLHWAAAGAALLGFALPAWASLGGDVSSVESDRAQMNASIQVTQHGAYDVHEIQMAAGTVVDEYVSPEGKVFAIAWHGQFPPPMQQILGSYFQQYTAALQAQPKVYGHRPLNIQQEGLVVQTGGHMRAYFGRAYVPDLLPQGVALSQIH